MEVTVNLKQALSFTATADTGFMVDLGAAASVGGDEDGFRPMELILIGLAGCTAMDVISILRKKRQEITAFKVYAQATQAEEHPKVFTDIIVKYVVHGVNVKPQAVARSVELSVTKYCPAQAMLGESVPIRHEWEIVEAGE